MDKQGHETMPTVKVVTQPPPPQECHMSTCEINVQRGLHNVQEVFLFWMTFAMKVREMSVLEGMDKQQLVHLQYLVG